MRRRKNLPREAAGTVERDPVTTRPSPDPLRRLGLSEYILLGLIVFGIAITVAMALFNS